MIGVRDDNGKTPSPSGSQHVKYSTRALPRTFGKMKFSKNWKKILAGHHLMNWQHILPTQLGSMGHYVVPGNGSPLVVIRCKAPQAPTTLRYFELENS